MVLQSHQLAFDRYSWRTVLLAVAIGASGCPTPYAPYSFWRIAREGGYENKRLPDGSHEVYFVGNAHTPRGVVVEYWHRRAAELCGGGDKYVIVEDETLREPRGVLGDLDKRVRARGRIKCVRYPAMLFSFEKNPQYDRLKGSRRPPVHAEGRSVVEVRPGIFYVSVLGGEMEPVNSVKGTHAAHVRAACAGLGRALMLQQSLRVIDVHTSSKSSTTITYWVRRRFREDAYVMCTGDVAPARRSTTRAGGPTLADLSVNSPLAHERESQRGSWRSGRRPPSSRR